MSRQSFTCAFLTASSAFVLLTAVSPIAQAAGQGKSGDHGNPASPGKSGEHGKSSGNTALNNTVNSILNSVQTSPVFDGNRKKYENGGNALQGQTNSLLKKLSKLSSGNPATTDGAKQAAKVAYKAAIASAQQGFQAAIQAANLVLKSALTAQLGLPTPTPSSA